MPRILIADDEADIRFLYNRWLIAGGHEPVEASDGPGVIDALRHTEVDMVVLDVMMPRMDGFEVCEKLRADGFTKPIVMVSALSSPADVARGSAVGATAYVEKVASRDDLLAMIARTISC